MSHPTRVVRTALWSLFTVSTAAGCHSTGPKTAAATARTEPQLVALPATASIAWVPPSVLIADASSEDDASATLGSVRQMRLDVEAVLQAEQWQVLDTDTAQYLATIALVKRTTMQSERRVVPGTETPVQTCDDRKTGGLCGKPSGSLRYQTVTVPVTTERVVFVIVRRHDGARHVHAGGFQNAKSAGGLLARQVITLLLAR